MAWDRSFEQAPDLRYPRRRVDLYIEEIDSEAIVYDPHNGAVHRYNETTFLVWNACDGLQTQSDITIALGKAHSIDSDQAATYVHDAIAGFRDRDLLLVEQSASFLSGDVQPQRASHYRARKQSHGLSRRELIGSGVTQAMLAAPVISTFFAAGAYASGPSASKAFGIDDEGPCKTVGYSCAVQLDCCQEIPAAPEQFCEAGQCCIVEGESGCVNDAQCCSAATAGCVEGTCEAL